MPNVIPETSAMLIITVALMIWDIFLAVDQEPGNTISETLQRASKRWWVIAYGWGVLAGHFFFTSPFETYPWLIAASLSTMGMLGLISGALRHPKIPRWTAFLVGLIHGWLIWGTS